MPSICLMENAGAGASRLALERRPSARSVVCLAGPGSNGGDAFVAARHLDAAGVTVRLVLLGEPDRVSAPDAAANLDACRALGIPAVTVPEPLDVAGAAAALAGADLALDGMFGTGLTRPLSGAAEVWVHALARSGVPVLALDLPSGLDCDTGEPLGPCVRAEATATFGFPKLGFANPGSRRWTGDVVVVPLGLRVRDA